MCGIQDFLYSFFHFYKVLEVSCDPPLQTCHVHGVLGFARVNVSPCTLSTQASRGALNGDSAGVVYCALQGVAAELTNLGT